MVIPAWRKEWDRKYCARYHRAGGDANLAPKELHGLGIPDNRYLIPLFRYTPLHYRPLSEFSIDNPPEQEEIILADVLSSGLDFYVYLDLDSLLVTYDMVEKDIFELVIPGQCIHPSQDVWIDCKIVEPDEGYKRHQVDHGWVYDLQNLALPVWLRVEPNELLKIQAVFEDPANQMTTLSVALSHRFRTQKLQEETIGAENLVKVQGEVWVSNYREGFFVFRERRDRPVRILVASDIHIAERHDTLAHRFGEANPTLCNFNDQARKLAEITYDGWRTGQIDYVVFCGDIVDYVLKDSFETEVNLHPSAEYRDDPNPYGMGEYFYNFSNLTADSGHPVLTGENGEPDLDNLARARAVLETLADQAQLSWTNWQLFREIFQQLIRCGVPTFLIPGNHDYLVFGYDLAGWDEETFDAFIHAVIGYSEAEKLTLLILAETLAFLTMGYFPVEFPPDYDPLAQHKSTGLTEAQAEAYDTDTTVRKLRSNYRTLLGSFYDGSALAGMAGVGATPVAHYFPADSFLVKQETKSTRLGFLNTGPVWDYLANASPWLVGFPEGEKKPNPALEQLGRWRDVHTEDGLILFMHAPPLSTFNAAQQGSEYWEEYNILLRGLYAGASDTPEEAATYTHMGIYLDPITGKPSYNMCKQQHTFFHGWIRTLNLLAPLLQYADPLYHKHPESSLYPAPETIKERSNPVLVFAGHTHWRHTYSLLRLVHPVDPPDLDSARCVHYLCGNQLVKELNQTSSGSTDETRRANAAAWWTSRCLVANTGCVGPIPPAEAAEEGAQQQAAASQGYYVVTIEDGVVTTISWNSLYYGA